MLRPCDDGQDAQYNSSSFRLFDKVRRRNITRWQAGTHPRKPVRDDWSELTVKTCSQVEDGAALAEFDGIADEADGIIFSRGNIGLDVAPEKMARVQKCVAPAFYCLT